MQWILVTGSSTGIGRATVELLASKGFGVYACARKQADLDELVKISNVVAIKMDVINNKEIADAFKLVSEKGTGLYGVVNNAGIAVPGPLMEITEEGLLHNIDVNILGVHRVTRAFYPLISQSKGRIVNVASINGFLSLPFNGSYCTSKFGVEGYSDALRRELMLLGIKVVVIEPGLIKTKIWDKATDDMENLKEKLKGSPFYEPAMKLGKDFVNSGKTQGINPMKVAEKIHLALILAEPKTRYRVTENDFRYTMAKRMSDKAIDKMVMKMLK